jgi:hypothetical protein
VAYTCNPSYSGSRDQEIAIGSQNQENSLRDSVSKNNQHKKGLVEWFKQ